MYRVVTPPGYARWGTEDHVSTTTTFKVAGMSCGHCVTAVTEQVAALEHVTGVDVELTTGLLTVTSNAALDPAAIVAAVDEAGYDVRP